jgi:hypothetical protein
MKKEIVITLITGIIGIIGAMIIMFTEEIKQALISNPRWIIFGVCVFLIVVSLLSIIIRWIIRINFKSLYDGQNKKLDEVQQLLKQSHEYNIDVTTMNHIICLSYLIKGKTKEIKKTAELLYSFYDTYMITIPQWEKYGIQKEVIDEMRKMYHENELQKIKDKNQPQKTNEPTGCQ